MRNLRFQMALSAVGWRWAVLPNPEQEVRKFEYEPDPSEDDMTPGETELAEKEVHRVVEVNENGEVTTVREDIDSDTKHIFPPNPEGHDRVTVLERGSDE